MIRGQTQKLLMRNGQVVGQKQKTILIGNRIPKEFFVTSGIGESDLTIHAGSFDEAMMAAGIENYNLMHYSSIMPAQAKRIQQPKKYVHGCVLETIEAVSNAEKGQRATAGIVFGWVVDKKTGKRIGGLVAEHNSHETEEYAKNELQKYIASMFESRFSNRDDVELKDVEILVRSIVPEKKYGTAMVVIGFSSHEVPVLDAEE